MELLIKLKFYEIKKLQEYICLDRWEGAYGKKKRNQFIYTTYSGNAVYAMRSFVGDTISGTGMADMRRKARISDLAFMIAEGCYYTSNVKKYMQRLFSICVISEIPFNLIMGSSAIYPFHQNVLWTFSVRGVIDTDH